MEYPVRTEDQIIGWDLERRVMLTKDPEGVAHAFAMTDLEIDCLRRFWRGLKNPQNGIDSDAKAVPSS